MRAVWIWSKCWHILSRSRVRLAKPNHFADLVSLPHFGVDRDSDFKIEVMVVSDEYRRGILG